MNESPDPQSAPTGGHLHDPVLSVVASLLERDPGDGLRVVELSAMHSTLVGREGRPLRVVRAPLGDGNVLALINALVETNTRAGTDVIVVGGSSLTTDAIRSAIPALLMNPLTVLHRRDDATVTAVAPAKGKASWRFTALEQARPLSDEERTALLSRVQTHAHSFREESRERIKFFKGLSGKRPVVTYALLGAIAVMFFLQQLWAPSDRVGDAASIFTIAMGALYTPLIEEGQWWRMISVGFLHGDLMHLGMNGFVLFLLGGQVERVLGSSRFLVLYTVSLLGGSYASAHFGHGFSVGASGAVWGLLGAQVSLAYGRPPVLPPTIRESLKPMAKQNILLNLGISFLPGIDAAAHIGGGIAGALVLFSGILYPAFWLEKRKAPPIAVERTPTFLKALAVFAALLLAYGVAEALLTGQPWRVNEHIEEFLPIYQ